MDNTPKVTVKTLRYHTHQGQEHQPGDKYEVEESMVESLQAQGMAVRSHPEDASEKPREES